MMKIRFGFVLGLAVGYYMGTKAGRERYQQMNTLISKAAHSAPVDKVVDLASEKAKDAVTSCLHLRRNHHHTKSNAFSPS